jgi:hypothetical protein
MIMNPLVDEKKCPPFKEIEEEPKNIKNRINQLFTQSVLGLPYEEDEHYILALDAIDLNTTEHLYNVNIHRISIPNPFECIGMNKKIRNNPLFINSLITIHPQRVGEFLNDSKSGPEYTAVWLDYTGCYDSTSTKTIPRDDLKLLFEKNKLLSPSILALTTSLRCRGGRNQVELVLNELPEMTSKYCFTLLDAGDYHGQSNDVNMGFAIVLVNTKDQ